MTEQDIRYPNTFIMAKPLITTHVAELSWPVVAMQAPALARSCLSLSAQPLLQAFARLASHSSVPQSCPENPRTCCITSPPLRPFPNRLDNVIWEGTTKHVFQLQLKDFALLLLGPLLGFLFQRLGVVGVRKCLFALSELKFELIGVLMLLSSLTRCVFRTFCIHCIAVDLDLYIFPSSSTARCFFRSSSSLVQGFVELLAPCSRQLGPEWLWYPG